MKVGNHDFMFRCFVILHTVLTSNAFALNRILMTQPHGKRSFLYSSTRSHVEEPLDGSRNTQAWWISAAVSFALITAGGSAPVLADGATKEFKLPPINLSDTTRCVLKSSAMGQANAARDSLYDLRQCKLHGSTAVGFDLSGVIMGGTDLSQANLQEAYFSKGYLQNSNFDGADFTNAIVDRANFKGSSLRGAIFKNTVLTATSFEGADVENADFTDAYLGDFDIKNLCKNPSLKGENPKSGIDTRLSVGCGNR